MFILFILIDVEESFNFDVCILCGWFDYGLKWLGRGFFWGIVVWFIVWMCFWWWKEDVICFLFFIVFIFVFGLYLFWIRKVCKNLNLNLLNILIKYICLN